MLPLYTITIFLGAFLLFLVQPMAAKVILPVLGGSPSVWNTCMVFFQAALLGGYAYADVLARARRPRVWAAVHGVVVLLPLLFLARAIPADPGAPPVGQGWDGPIPWLLVLLATTIGPFFLVLSTTGPLLQRWFAATDHPSAKDPYFLYAASNAGSLFALIGYPVVVERYMDLDAQARLFSGGFVAYAALVLACGAVLVRRGSAVVAPALRAGAGVTGRQRLMWVALAFVPSSLMLGVTQYLSTDIAAVPLLWVVPLSLYLLTFILAFATRQVLPLRAASILMPVAVLAVLGTMMATVEWPLTLLVGLHLAAMFLASFVCHRRLALSRPGAAGLTQYYLLIAVGGVLGGVFNALLAPIIFTSITEYPIALVLACLMLPGWTGAGASARASAGAAGVRRDRLVALGMIALPAGLAGLGIRMIDLNDAEPWVVVAWAGVSVALCAASMFRPRRFAAALGLLLVVATLRPDPWGTLLFARRTFFGEVRVYLDRREKWYEMLHGTTRHGIQANHPEYRKVPALYYHRGGPIGDVFRAHEADPGFDRCAFVGLGVGTLAAYGRPGLEFTFYELDPVVAAVARSTELFHYLEDSRAVIRPIVLGDARLRLHDAPDGGYDLIVLDAFSSDAVPVHLLTREAIGLYLAKLAPGGTLAFHVSNRYLDLRPVLAGAARDLGLVAASRTDRPTEDQQGMGAVASTWVLVARKGEDLRTIMGMPGWVRLEAGPGVRAWTDRYSNVLGAFGARGR